MAMSASLSINPSSSSYVNMPIQCLLTISNSGGGAVSVNSIAPLVWNTSGAPQTNGSTPVNISGGSELVGPNAIVSVPASGSLEFTFSCVFSAPSNGTYSIGANISTADGSFFSPTAQTITINKN